MFVGEISTPDAVFAVDWSEQTAYFEVRPDRYFEC